MLLEAEVKPSLAAGTFLWIHGCLVLQLHPLAVWLAAVKQGQLGAVPVGTFWASAQKYGICNPDPLEKPMGHPQRSCKWVRL